LEALLLREGAQEFLVKAELDAEPLARRMKHAVERQRHVNSLKVDELATIAPLPHAESGMDGETMPLDLIAIAELSMAD
jgi:hypothetical protein